MTCLTVCPTHYYKSVTVLGVTGIYVCQTCSTTCAECSILPTNCTACYTTQNRVLSAFTCPPAPGFYEAAADVAFPCAPTCLTCTLTATNCLSCATGLYLSAGTCLTCASKYGANCTSCNPTVCTACQAGYIVAGNGLSCINCSFYHASCMTCLL